MANESPTTLEKGQKILLKESGSGNGTKHLEGQVLEVVKGTKGGNAFSIIAEDGKTYSIYTPNGNMSGIPPDTYVFASREEQIIYTKELVEKKQAELDVLAKELDYLEKYASEEEFVAHKLQQLFQAKGNKEAMVEVLRELKKSHYL